MAEEFIPGVPGSTAPGGYAPKRPEPALSLWDYLSSGQERRRWLERQEQAVGGLLSHYLGPAAAPVQSAAMLAGYMTPGADMMDASAAGRELFSAETPMDAATAAATMAAAGGMMLLPGSVGALREGFNSTVDEMAGAYDPTVLNANGFRAYHGSPHTFDRFDISKIGTGEGAQAYGHGLYFAENEGVARAYRDNLAGVNLDGGPPTFMGQNIRPKEPAPRWAQILEEEGSVQGALFRLNRMNDLQGMEDLQAAVAAGRISPAGSMYEVQINADPSQFLDWDAPLSAQPQAVRKAIETRYTPAMERMAERPGSQFYDYYLNGTVQPVHASSDLAEIGIPGIRYLDAGSRAAGDGSRNFVVFDDSIIDILRRYGIGGAAVGGGWALSPGDAQAATDAGILDQQERERQSIIDWLGSL
jgi:hypothetical protein